MAIRRLAEALKKAPEIGVWDEAHGSILRYEGELAPVLPAADHADGADAKMPACFCVEKLGLAKCRRLPMGILNDQVGRKWTGCFWLEPAESGRDNVPAPPCRQKSNARRLRTRTRRTPHWFSARTVIREWAQGGRGRNWRKLPVCFAELRRRSGYSPRRYEADIGSPERGHGLRERNASSGRSTAVLAR
jgi:hypothetical protein